MYWFYTGVSYAPVKSTPLMMKGSTHTLFLHWVDSEDNVVISSSHSSSRCKSTAKVLLLLCYIVTLFLWLPPSCCSTTQDFLFTFILLPFIFIMLELNTTITYSSPLLVHSERTSLFLFPFTFMHTSEVKLTMLFFF